MLPRPRTIRGNLEDNVFRFLDSTLVKTIVKYGYIKPTSIQAKAIPLILQGNHVLVIGPTGSGKTEAALFPVYSLALKDLKSNEINKVLILYITPLRALNRDILKRMSKIAQEVGLKVAVRHGDTSQYERRRMLKDPPHMLITTPETLQFLLVGRRIREILNGVKWVIIDEVHELLDSKRGSILAAALERLVAHVGYDFQRIGLSATIGDVEEAKRFVGGIRRVEVIEESRIKPMEIIVDSPLPSKKDRELSLNSGLQAETIARLRRIVELITNAKSSIVFTNTRDLAELLASRFRLLTKINVSIHHGSLSKDIRVNVEESLKQGLIKSVISTSSLELGIDIGHVDLVIQYGSPRQAVKLIQRIGRSGHHEYEVSRGAIISLNSLDDILESAVLARRAIHGDFEKPSIYDVPLDVLAYQIVGLTLEYNMVDVNFIYKILKRSHPFLNLTFSQLIDTIKFISLIGLIRYDGKFVKRTRRAWRYYHEVSMIPDVKHYFVKDVVEGKIIGQLDEEFVISNCEKGFKFILSGMVWEVLDYDDKYVYVEPTNVTAGVLPWWEGELIPVNYKVSREVGSLKRRLIKEGENILKLYPLTDTARKVIKAKIEEQFRKAGFLPTDEEVVIESLDNLLVIHAHLGSKGNYGLSLIMLERLESLGYNVKVKSDPYRIFIIGKISPEVIIKILRTIDVKDLSEIVKNSVAKSNMFRWRLYNIAKRFGALISDVSIKDVSRILSSYVDTLIGYEALKETLTDKIDFNALKDFITKLKKNHIRITIIKLSSPSPITLEALNFQSLYDIVIKTVTPNVLLDIFRKKVLSKKVKLLCLMCGRVLGVVKVQELPDKIKCKKCGSGFITVVSPNDTTTEALIKKRIRKSRLSHQEKSILKEEVLKADLVLRYGKYAVIALSTFGVGPKTAAKIVGKHIYGDIAFFKALFEAEINFLKTRKYWDT